MFSVNLGMSIHKLLLWKRKRKNELISTNKPVWKFEWLGHSDGVPKTNPPTLCCYWRVKCPQKTCGHSNLAISNYGTNLAISNYGIVTRTCGGGTSAPTEKWTFRMQEENKSRHPALCFLSPPPHTHTPSSLAASVTGSVPTTPVQSSLLAGVFAVIAGVIAKAPDLSVLSGRFAQLFLQLLFF